MHPRIVGRLCQTLARSRAAFNRNAQQERRSDHAFTLIELLVVIAIIIILAGLLYPAYNAVQNQAKRTQAKNDLTQIVNAVNAYYTEYGKYPVVTDDTPITTDNSDLFYTLRAIDAGTANAGNAANPRKIVFINPPNVKDDTAGNRRAGVSFTDGRYYDPWGTPYKIVIDGTYDNSIANPYGASANAGPDPLATGGIAWSWGNGQTQDTDVKAGDDVISWQ